MQNKKLHFLLKKKLRKYNIIFLFFLFSACKNSNRQNESNQESSIEPKQLGYTILKILPHDTSAFTEGLAWHNDFLYESTGLENKTKIYKIDLATGTIIQKLKVPDPTIFGEGITIFQNKIYQLTWKNHIAVVYDLNTFKKRGQFEWPHEGWGVTNNGKMLIISTGQSFLYFVNPLTFKVEKRINVEDNYGPVGNINELEFVNGYIYANIWGTNTIIKINAETGKVAGKISLNGILEKGDIPYNPAKIDVLNGIAYNPQNNHFLITGKYWPALFEIELN